MTGMRRHIIVLFLGAMLALSSSLMAQHDSTEEEYHFISRGIALDLTLQKLVNKTDIDLIYDPKLMRDHIVFVAAKNKNAEELLRLILEDSGLDFIQLSSGTYVLVENPRKKNVHSQLSGKVVDGATGQPLDGANVMLADASTGTSTNSAGYFNISKLEPGPHQVTVTYVGYQSIKDTVWVPANNPTQQTFSLNMKPVWVEPIIVSGTQKKLPAADAFTSSVKSPQKQTLGTVDAVKSLNTVMGINFNLAMADYSIQGGNTGENQLRLDGVPVYNPVSMGRLIGAFSPYALGNISIHKAGYGSTVGSQLSGVVDLKHDLGNNKKQSLLVQADPLSVNGRFDHRFNLENGPQINLMLAARTNIWRWYQKPSLSKTFRDWDQIDPLLTNSLLDISETDMNYLQEDHHSDIRYSDIHFAASIEHNDFKTTRISGYRGTNFLQTDLFSQNVVLSSEAPSYMSTIDRYNWTNMMGKIEHQWLISSRLDASISGYMTKHTLNHQYALGNDLNTNLNFSSDQAVSDQLREGAITNMDTGDKNGVVESAIDVNTSYSISKNYQLKAGLKATHFNYRFKLSNLYQNIAQSQSTSFLVSNYIQNNIQLSHKTSLSLGNRLTLIPSRDLVFAEPRFSIQHDEPNTSIGYLSGKLSGGIYRQFINQFDVSNIGPSALVPSIRFWVPVDYSTDIPKAYHIAANTLWEPGPNWILKTESYYKWIPKTLSLGYGELVNTSGIAAPQNLGRQVQYISTSKKFAYGTGVSIKRVFPSLKMRLNAEYQYSIAERSIPRRFGGKYEPVPWNKPHQLAFSAEWQAFANLMVMLQWKSIWGRSWAFRKAYYDYLSIYSTQSFGDYSFNNPSADRLAPFHQLDAGLSYKLSLKNSDLQLRLHVFNVLDHSNVINWWLSPTKNADGTISYNLNKRTLPGFSPSFSITFSL